MGARPLPRRPLKETASDGLAPSEVIYDGHWSQIGRLRDETGRSFIRKVSKFPLQPDGLAVVEFLHALSAQPHPNLLIPERFTGEVGALLVEDYPDLTGQPRLDTIGHELRSRLAGGALSLAQIVDFVVQLSDAVGFIHRTGFVHQDVRARNVFVRTEGERLIPTLFDYTFIVRPFFLIEGRLIADLEAPPEVRVGYVKLDARYDVYQLGWILRNLTHYEAGPDLWRPVATLADGLETVIARATGPLAQRHLTAAALRDDLHGLNSTLT
jgi:serine/threonine protein kinase